MVETAIPAIRPHHLRAIQRLVDTFKDDGRYLALIIGGSIVKGRAQENSDVDFVLVATDEEYARRALSSDFQWFSWELAGYEGGYVDGKVVDVAFLRDVAEKGNEPCRSAFCNALIAWSRSHEVDQLVASIPTYPEAEWSGKISSFHAQLEALRWFMGEAEKRKDAYLAVRTAADAVLYGSRMILAHNRVFFQSHKWLMRDLAECSEKPDGIVPLAEAALAAPSLATLNAFADAVLSFTQWEKAPEGWVSRFMHDAEWHWRRGEAPLSDR